MSIPSQVGHGSQHMNLRVPVGTISLTTTPPPALAAANAIYFFNLGLFIVSQVFPD